MKTVKPLSRYDDYGIKAAHARTNTQSQLYIVFFVQLLLEG